MTKARACREILKSLYSLECNGVFGFTKQRHGETGKAPVFYYHSHDTDLFSVPEMPQNNLELI